MSNCRRGLATDSGDRGLDESLVQQFPEPSIHAARGSVSGWHTEGPRTAIIIYSLCSNTTYIILNLEADVIVNENNQSSI